MNTINEATGEATIASNGPKFAFATAEGVERQIFISGHTIDTSDLVVGEVRTLSYKVLPDGKLRATSVGAKGSRLPQPKVVDRAKDGSWTIYKLECEMLYRVTRVGQTDEDCDTLAAARELVGKVITPPKVVGGKTNDPAVSQRMRQPKGQVKMG